MLKPKYIKQLILPILLLLCQGVSFASINQAQLDDRVKAYVKDKPIKAMIYGLWVDGEPVSINAIGESMSAVKANNTMSFRIGGVTETLLTTSLMKLVEQKKVKLNDRVDKWYPKLPNAKKVTLQMLANGTSGYPDYVYNKSFIRAVVTKPFKQWSDNELLDYAFASIPLFSPGTSQHYSHTDYVILANIVSRVTKQPLNDVFQKLILNPLLMHKTRFDKTAIMPYPVLHSFSQDRGVYEDATFWSPSWTSSTGAMVSTIEELGAWGNAWMHGILLTENSTQQLRAPKTVGKGKNKNKLYFAMGFGVANHWLMQNPSFGGYSGIFAVLPEENIVLIAYNTLNENANTNTNYSMALWEKLAPDLAPDYPVPKFN
jgi:D-alanyl-D-alanine carboxypeptidase